ncbi:MAG: alpha/beta hydrolase [Candidatus Cryptobacteroides sp.]
MAKKSALRTVLYVIAGIAAVILIILGFASRYMLGFSLYPDPNRSDTDSTYNVLYGRFPDMKPWVDSVLAAGALRDTFIVMPGGERQHALWMACDKACGKTAVFVHGYKDNAVKYLYMARLYNRDLNYNILMPELHAHGLSDGEEIQMGWKDADDILVWIRVAEELFRDASHPISMVIHGVSMGAATTMNVSAKELPPYVNAFIEDCGYTSVWDEFSTQLKDMFGLPSFPLMNCTSLLCRMKYGWDFKEASPLESVSRCKAPMLFIHGDADTFVPYWMMHPLYEAKPGPKECWTAPGSKHARAYKDHPEEYTERVKNFLEKYN